MPLLEFAEFGLQLLHPTPQLLIFCGVLLSLLVLFNDLQELVDLFLGTGHVCFFFFGQHFALVFCLLHFCFQFLEGRGQFFFVVEELGDEPDVVLHHQGQFLFLLLEGTFKFAPQDVLQAVQGGLQTVILSQ